MAEILVRAVQRRLRRNLSAELQVTRADLTRVRGRVDHLRTRRHSLLERGKVACRFEELTTDTPRNRYVLAAFHKLVNVVTDDELSRRCRVSAGALQRAGVGSKRSWNPSGEAPPPTGRANTEDRRMLAAARLAHDLSLPTEETGRSHLPSPEREQRWVRRLFEAGVGGFYDTVLVPRGWRARTGTKHDWQVDHLTDGIERILPTMEIDIVLQAPASRAGPGQRLVIDTKSVRG